MNRAFSIDVAGRLTPICCTFCSLPGFSGPPLNKYGLKVPAHRGDVCVNIFRHVNVEHVDVVVAHNVIKFKKFNKLKLKLLRIFRNESCNETFHDFHMYNYYLLIYK